MLLMYMKWCDFPLWYTVRKQVARFHTIVEGKINTVTVASFPDLSGKDFWHMSFSAS